MVQKKKNNFIRYIAITGILSALSFVLQMLEFPLPMIIPTFIQFDFSDLPALIAAFSMGPQWGVLVAFIKNLVHLPMTSTAGAGEFANFLLSAVFVASAGTVYRIKRNRGGALIGSLTGAFVMSLLSVPINYFITYPVYYKAYHLTADIVLSLYQAIYPYVESVHTALWIFNAPFNLVKGLVIAAIAFVIYKYISPLIKGVRPEENEARIFKRGMTFGDFMKAPLPPAIAWSLVIGALAAAAVIALNVWY